MPVKSLRSYLKIKIISRMNGLCYDRLFLVVYCQETLGKSSCIIFNEFLFNKSLKAKCLSSQLTAKRLEIPALCMVCAVLSIFVKNVFLHVLIPVSFNTARPHRMLF